MPITTAAIEVPLGADFPQVHCPACGAPVFSGNAYGGCKHLAFCYVSEVDEAEMVPDHLAETVAQAKNEAEETDRTLIEVLLEKLDRGSMFCLEITSGGMACGPVWTTAYIAFDFDPPDA